MSGDQPLVSLIRRARGGGPRSWPVSDQTFPFRVAQKFTAFHAGQTLSQLHASSSPPQHVPQIEVDSWGCFHWKKMSGLAPAGTGWGTFITAKIALVSDLSLQGGRSSVSGENYRS